jgi:hypothetical protein
MNPLVMQQEKAPYNNKPAVHPGENTLGKDFLSETEF